MLVILSSAILYSMLNRFAGGGLDWKVIGRQYGGPLPGRAIWYAAALAFALCAAAIGDAAALACAASFLLWRTIGWYNAIDAGTNTETARRDFRVMSAIGLLLAPAFIFAAWRTQNYWLLVLIPATALGIGAAYHAAWHLKALHPFNKDGVARAEYLAGAVIGIAFATAYAEGSY